MRPSFVMTVMLISMAAAVPARGAAVPSAAVRANQFLTRLANSSPQQFEPYLREHPADEPRREAALVWYSRHEGNLERLQYHTLQMVKYHPANTHIIWENLSAFYADPQHRLQVIARLEEKLKEGPTGHDLYWNLAKACEQGALPPVDADPESRERFLRYYRLPKNTVLPCTINQALANKAARYYRSAIKDAEGDRFYLGYYSQQLADLLRRLGKCDQALVVCRSALPHADEISKPDLLVTYGRVLRNVGRLKEAKQELARVRACDHEGFENGPGCASARADTEMGFIALQQGNSDEAGRLLLSSCNVQRCCHSSGNSASLKLAKRLLKNGQRQAVIKYCELFLAKFAPGQKETEGLLGQAMQPENRAASSVHSGD